MDIQINSPTYVFGDNKAVLVNSAVHDSVLKKKSNSIAYHFVREGTASDEWRTTYVQSENNIPDMLTKPFGAEKRRRFLGMTLHDSS